MGADGIADQVPTTLTAVLAGDGTEGDSVAPTPVAELVGPRLTAASFDAEPPQLTRRMLRSKVTGRVRRM